MGLLVATFVVNQFSGSISFCYGFLVLSGQLNAGLCACAMIINTVSHHNTVSN